jgi:hypothetical protein
LLRANDQVGAYVVEIFEIETVFEILGGLAGIALALPSLRYYIIVYPNKIMSLRLSSLDIS